MDQSRIREWESLACAGCGTGTSFIAIMELRMREGSGMVPVVKGYECQVCHTMANTGTLQLQAEIRRQERELKEREDALRILKQR